MSEIKCSCPYCGFTVTIPEGHDKEHDKICCMNCNKAFPLPTLSARNQLKFLEKEDETDDWFE
jgi:hypothetical protein